MRSRWCAIGVAAALLATGCSSSSLTFGTNGPSSGAATSPTSTSSTATPNATANPTTAPSPAGPTAGRRTAPSKTASPSSAGADRVAEAPAGALTLLTEPDQGLGPVYALIAAARRSVDVTMYELVDVQAEGALEAAARRGVDVRVVLDINREEQANQPAYGQLRAAGVHVVWAATRYAATHEKALVVDGQLAVVMTLNLTSRYYSSTRDFAVLDRDPTDVAAIERVFTADYNHAKTATPAGDDLVWSPGASEPALLALIAGARHTLAIENEEMASKPILGALLAAATRGVAVTVVMTDDSNWHQAFATLTRAGARVYVYAADAALYIHAKVVVADAGQPTARAFVGSENFSATSLDSNRELGLITADPTVVRELNGTVATDAAGGTRWTS
jgi:cardiolipin synthase